MLSRNELTSCCAVQWLSFSAAHPALPGHFPDHPVIPGVVLLARVHELLRSHLPQQQLRALPAVKFLQPVLPDEPLLLGIEFQTLSDDRAQGRFMLRRNQQLVAQGNFVTEAAA